MSTMLLSCGVQKLDNGPLHIRILLNPAPRIWERFPLNLRYVSQDAAALLTEFPMNVSGR